MPHAIAPGFISETEIRHAANLLNINHYPDHHVVAGWGKQRLTAGDLRRLCITAMIGARLIECSSNLASDYGFRVDSPETLPQR